ncbi:ABC transporter permease [Corynebacterium sp. 13CS0277]|uniref:ABC transporter permease n=1 Tax=Corynebacterium sp. 13CS0277 TaxID=2071994 RepID=UPI000D02F887|nr:ABC transporter permease [Corynebacterium sp. 13CS0277]PRQ12134.1 ABC transporter permease [Corynebacterium sp. 13CS0277]
MTTSYSTTPPTLPYVLREVGRLRNDVSSIFFSIVLPVVFYVLFGSLQNFADEPVGDGNINAYVMIGMALYAGMVGAVSATAAHAVELASGWRRQLALTPLSTTQLLVGQIASLAVRTVLPVAAVFITGAVAGAQMPTQAWAASFLITTAVALPFGFYGLIVTHLITGHAGVTVAATSLIVLCFAANIMAPLTEPLLRIARFTPAYGAAGLARYPLAEGTQALSSAPFVAHDELAGLLINFSAWTLALLTLYFLLAQGEKGRR